MRGDALNESAKESAQSVGAKRVLTQRKADARRRRNKRAIGGSEEAEVARRSLKIFSRELAAKEQEVAQWLMLQWIELDSPYTLMQDDGM
jgi:hypothetical protein